MNKYQLKITPYELSIRPYFSYMPKIRLFVILFIVVFGSLIFFHNLLDADIIRIVIAVGVVLLFYIIYDYLFHVNVRFLFDKRTRSVYKVNIVKKRLMAFDEMTILTNSEYGDITYIMGKKKNQFVKNYTISDTFGTSKKHQAREKEYIEQILHPILEFVK
jgi:hypothetical protein